MQIERHQVALMLEALERLEAVMPERDTMVLSQHASGPEMKESLDAVYDATQHRQYQLYEFYTVDVIAYLRAVLTPPEE